MSNEEITALAREYAELTDGSPVDIAYRKAIAENAFRFLLRRFYLVEKSKVGEDGLDIAWRAKEYGTVILSKENVYYLFPEIGKEVEDGLV